MEKVISEEYQNFLEAITEKLSMDEIRKMERQIIKEKKERSEEYKQAIRDIFEELKKVKKGKGEKQ